MLRKYAASWRYLCNKQAFLSHFASGPLLSRTRCSALLPGTGVISAVSLTASGGCEVCFARSGPEPTSLGALLFAAAALQPCSPCQAETLHMSDVRGPDAPTICDLNPQLVRTVTSPQAISIVCIQPLQTSTQTFLGQGPLGDVIRRFLRKQT